MEPDSKPTLTQRIRSALSDWYLGKEVRGEPYTLCGAVFHDYYRGPPSRLAKTVACLVSSGKWALKKLSDPQNLAVLAIADLATKWFGG